jgi:hypothetical protein
VRALATAVYRLDDGLFLGVLLTLISQQQQHATLTSLFSAFFTKTNKQTDIGKTTYNVFFNQNSKNSDVAGAILQAGYVARVWDSGDIDSEDKWNRAVDSQFHHITTNQVNYHEDAFSRTHNDHGYPFQPLDPTIDVSSWQPDEGNLMYMTADTGDAWGRVDDLNYVYYDASPPGGGGGEPEEDQWTEYTTSVSLANSHCEKFAKAGIMLREEDPRFPIGTGQYFAVVRTCEQLVRVQYRELAYLFTAARTLSVAAAAASGDNATSSADGIENAKRVSLKLRVRYYSNLDDGSGGNGNNGTVAEGYFKLEGTDRYVLIERKEFPNVRFALHGLFASSHHWSGNADGTPFKALFVDARRNGLTLTAADFTNRYGSSGGEFEFGDGFGGAASGGGRRAAAGSSSSSLRG